MARISDSTTSERKDRLLRLLRQEGQLTEAEIAAHLNLERRTINNCLRELEYDAQVEKDGVCWMLSVGRAYAEPRLFARARPTTCADLAANSVKSGRPLARV